MLIRAKFERSFDESTACFLICYIQSMAFILFLLSIYFLIEALVKKETKLFGAPVVTKKDRPQTYKLYLVFYCIIVLFSILGMTGLLDEL